MLKLPPAGGNSSEVVHVNDRGHAIVEGRPDYGSFYLFWSSETGYRYMAYKEKSIGAFNLNNRDEVVGVTERGLGVIWSPDRVKTFSAPDGYHDLLPRFIDDDGQVFGSLAEDGSGIRHGFHLSSDGVVIVDRPGKSVCPVAIGPKGVAVIQPMAAPSYTCWCSEPHSDYLVRGAERQRIRVPGKEKEVCIHDVDLAGDVLVTLGEYDDKPGLWSPDKGYQPIGLYVGNGNLAGVADGGVVAGNGTLDGVWQAFLWDRKSGAHAVTAFLHDKEQLDGLRIDSISPHGVLGGGFDRKPVILLPSH